MAKTQTITFKKAGSSWATWEDARIDMLAAINATSINTDDYLNNHLPNTPCDSASLDNETQLYTEVRIWNDDEYTTYKNNISSIDSPLQNELIADGWEITNETVHQDD
tara:strand:+ start:863 stop:1186 length:324 start_codon:yes stop_codon:yes gene_type:complete